MTRAFAMAVAALAACAGPLGCRRDTPPAAGPVAANPASPASSPRAASNATPGAAAPPELVSETFEELYPVFLLRKLSDGPKFALWRERYQGRWVRWTGRLVSHTAHGATFAHLPQTKMFDVSLRLDQPGLARVRRFKPGDTVTYVGQLHRFEEVVRIFYLAHGDVTPAAAPDLVDSPRKKTP